MSRHRPPSSLPALLALTIAVAGTPLAAENAPGATKPDPGIPGWALEHMASRVGTWIAENPARGDDGHEAYGMDWSWAPGKKSVVGRLYPIRDGRDLGTVWQFREFWHPGEGRLMAFQWGTDGTVGLGSQTRQADGSMEVLQEFFDPAGPRFRVGHRARIGAAEMRTTSFNVDASGNWQTRQAYVWKKQPGK